MVGRAPRCGPAGGSPVRDAGHVCRTHAFRLVTIRSSIDLHRRSTRAHELSRRVQRTASTLIPRAPSEVGVVDPAAGLCQAPVKRLTQGCGSTLETSESRLRLCSPASTPRWKGRVSSFPTRYPEPSESSHEAVRTPDLESRSLTLFLCRACRIVALQRV